MEPFTPEHLFQALRECGQFSADQLKILDSVPTETLSDTAALADTLWNAKLLTAYQTRKLRLNRLAEILFGQYLVLDKIGEGGMGKVFKAIQCKTGKLVALKVVRAHLMANKTVVGRYRREAAAAAKLNHPNIVSLLDADEAQGRYFLAMEFVYGSDLSRMVKEFGPLPSPEAAEYIRQGALGLQHAHENGLIHRDIKPSNMLVSGERALPDTGGVAVVRILDMGLVRSLLEEDDSAKTELTRDGTVVGTPDYMAPEQAKNSSTVDHRADIYSLGCTLYYLLAGKPPFPEGTPIDKLLRHQLDPPPDLRKQRPDVPDEMIRTMNKMMAKRPEDRIASAGEVARILAQFTAEGLAKTPEIVLKMPDQVPSQPEPVAAQAPVAAAKILEAEVVTRKPSTITQTVARKPAVRLVPREADSGDSMTIQSTPSKRKDSSEDNRTIANADDATRSRSRETEAAVVRQKRLAKARIANKRRKNQANWMPIVLGIAGISMLVVVGWLLTKSKPEVKPTVVENKVPEQPKPVAPAGLPPAWVNIPNNTAAVIVVYPELCLSRIRDQIDPKSRLVRAMNHLATKYRFDIHKGERFTVALASGPTPSYAATIDSRNLTDEALNDIEKWPGITTEKFGTARRLRYSADSSKSSMLGLLSQSRRGYTLTNEESLFVDLAQRTGQTPPRIADALLTALPDPLDSNRPTLTFAATGDWTIPEGLTLSELGAEQIVLHARLIEDRFDVDIEILGKSKERINDFVNLRLWDVVNSKHSGIKPFLQAITENTANDGWDMVGSLHRLKKTESGVWALPTILKWLERLMPD